MDTVAVASTDDGCHQVMAARGTTTSKDLRHPPDLVLDPYSWFQMFDRSGQGLELCELVEGCQRTFYVMDGDLVKKLVEDLWPMLPRTGVDSSGAGPSVQRVSREHFLTQAGWRHTLLRLLGEPPLPKIVGPYPMQESTLTSPLEHPPLHSVIDGVAIQAPAPAFDGKHVRDGLTSLLPLPDGVVGVTLHDGPDARKLVSKCPLAVQEFMAKKNIASVYNSFIRAIVETRTQPQSVWKNETLICVLNTYRKRFESFGVAVYLCQAPVEEERLYKWVEFIDTSVASGYEPRFRFTTGSSVCRIM
eukprot:TRINITY_DN32466_c0_g1_i1.p1 TRINITY_DN32466_c0_g1~~TRINITY_DN32466_c0_g1_i1.p1  ORF type:complete len:342 (+),score=56.50 TRINITY_DN32466_c0_g1_i1:118-1026(+)